MLRQRLQAWWRGQGAQPLRPLLEWLVRYPVLVALGAVPLSIVWGALESLGLPGLFFHDVRWVSLLAGFSATLLLGELCFIGYLLDADELWALAPRGGKPGGVAPSVWWYLLGTGTWPFLLALLTLPAFIERRFAFLLGVAAGVVVAVVLTRLAEWGQRQYLANRKSHPYIRRFEALFFRRRSRLLAVLHLLQAWLLGLLVLAYLVVSATVALGGRTWVAPAVILCVVVGVLAAIYGAVRFFFPHRHMGAHLLGLGLFVLAFRGLADECMYDELAQPQARLYSSLHLARPQEAGLLEEEEVLGAWLERMRAQPPRGAAWVLAPASGSAPQPGGEAPPCTPGPKPRMVLVATSGGGIRASAWTAHMLEELEAGVGGFHRYVRLVTGASGGMVGAGAWVAGLGPEGTPVEQRGELARLVRQDSLSPVALAMLLPVGEDRGRALERAWREQTAGRLGRTFSELREGEAQGWRPSLVYSPMVVEDGRRLLVSNLDLTALTTSATSALAAHGDEVQQGSPLVLQSMSSVQLFQLFPRSQGVLALSAAARMSAAFPYVSPASRLPTEPPVRVVDAGYYDNYGVDVAATWMHVHREWLRACTSGVLLVQVRDRLDSGVRTRLQAEPSPVAALLGGVSTPAEAIFRARESSMSFRNDALLSVLHAELNQGAPCFFATVAFELERPAPLSWSLSAEEAEQLERAAKSEPIRQRVEAVRQWLGEGPLSQLLARRANLCLQGATGGR